MASLNKAMLIGNLGRDPEIRYTGDGRAITNFTLATKEEWRDKETNEKKDRTEWHRIVVYGKLAEICGQYLSKGKQVYIEGRIQTREWEDKEGNKRTTTEIVAGNMVMLGSRGDGPTPSPRPVGGKSSASENEDYTPQSGPYADQPDDDIPF
jgi:single-strand DNA-binding protein